MHYANFILAALPFLSAVVFAEDSAHAEHSDFQELGLNATQTLFEAVYPDPEKFNDKCTGAYKLITKILKNNETIVVADYNALIQEQRNAGKVPEELDFNMDVLDSDKDGKVSRDELCSQIESGLKAKTVGDLHSLQIDEASLSQLKPLVCTWKDKIPFMKDHLCKAVEEAQEKIEDDKEQQEKSVELNKRQLSKQTVNLLSGLAFFYGILLAFTAFGAFFLMFAAPVYILALIFNTIMSIIFIKLGSSLKNDAKRAV